MQAVFVSAGSAPTANTHVFDSQDPLGSLDKNTPDLPLEENTPELQFEKRHPMSPMDLSMHDTSAVLEADLKATGNPTPQKSTLFPRAVDKM